MLLKRIFIICAFLTNYSLLSQESTNVLLSEYLLNSFNQINNFDSINIILMSPVCEKISHEYIKEIKIPHRITAEDYPRIKLNLRDLNVIFLDNLKTINHILHLLDVNTFIATTSYIQIIFCEKIAYDSATELIKKMWTNLYFINTAITFVNNDFVQTINYHPFEDSIINVTSNMFPLKTDDLNGYKLNVTLYVDFPKILPSKSKPGEYDGIDIRRMELIKRIMNFTTTIVALKKHDNTDAIKLIVTGKADVCFTASFFCRKENDRRFSYPMEMDSLVVLIPKANITPHYQYIFQVFNSKLSIIILIVLILIAFAASIEVKFSFSERLLIAFGSLFGISMKPLNKKLSFIFTSWIIFSMIVVVEFKSVLFSRLLKLSYERTITNVAELENSNLTIYCSRKHYPLIMNHFKSLSSQIVVVHQSQIFEMIRNDMWNSTYIVTKSSATALITRFNLIDKEIQFQIMKQSLIPGFLSYVLNKRSPFLKGFKESTLKDAAFGLTVNRRYATSVLNKIGRDTKETYLTLSHFCGPFLVLGVNHTISILVFLGECIYYYIIQK